MKIKKLTCTIIQAIVCVINMDDYVPIENSNLYKRIIVSLVLRSQIHDKNVLFT